MMRLCLNHTCITVRAVCSTVGVKKSDVYGVAHIKEITSETIVKAFEKKLLLAGCSEANVPSEFLLNFVELQGRQFGPIFFINKISLGVLL